MGALADARRPVIVPHGVVNRNGISRRVGLHQLEPVDLMMLFNKKIRGKCLRNDEGVL